jgi:hypothetical protein
MLKDGAMKRSSERGQSLVEGALVLVLLLAMILFIVEIGRVMMLGQYVTERARVTARAATVNDWTQTQVQNYLVHDKAEMPAGGEDKAGFLGLKSGQVAYQVLGTRRNGDLRVQVEVSNIESVMYIPWMAGKYKFPPVTVELPAQSLGATN